MRIPFFTLLLASAACAQTPSFWQTGPLMPSPFGKPAPRVVTPPPVRAAPLITGASKMVLAKPERCTPPMPAMKRPKMFSAMPVVPADPAVDPGIVEKVRVCQP